MNERIKMLISEQGLSASKFADVIGVQASGISHIISGRNKPGYDFIVKVLESFPEINPDWLLLGKGEMLRNRPTAAAEQAAISDDLFAENNRPYGSIAETTKPDPLKAPSVINPGKDAPENTNMLHVQDTSPSTNTQESTYRNPSAPIIKEKAVESVIVFYSDKSFTAYKPE